MSIRLCILTVAAFLCVTLAIAEPEPLTDIDKIVDTNWDTSTPSDMQKLIKTHITNTQPSTSNLVNLIDEHLVQIEKSQIVIRAILSSGFSQQNLTHEHYRALLATLRTGPDASAATAVACLTAAESHNRGRIPLTTEWISVMRERLQDFPDAQDLLAWRLLERAKQEGWERTDLPIDEFHAQAKYTLVNWLAKIEQILRADTFLSEIKEKQEEQD